MQFTRFAVYHLPPPGPLAAFGAAWLGWDVARGIAAAPPEDMPDDAGTLTAAPRKYGFHATLKAPFRLDGGAAPADLRAAMRALASDLPPVRLDGLSVRRLGAFIALTPDGPVDALNALAGRIVTDLDRFRAPAGAAELARRRASGLTPAQDDLLLRWGYPYVLDEFRFHMTLTGPVAIGGDEVLRDLKARLAPILPRPYAVDEIALCGEGPDGRFRLIERYALTGAR